MAKKQTALAAARPRVVREVTARAMAGATGTFAIMLDDLLRVHPHHFPVTARHDEIGVLRRVSQHNNRFVLVPRSGLHADLLENKDLVNAITGSIDDGAIYLLTERGAGE